MELIQSSKTMLSSRVFIGCLTTETKISSMHENCSNFIGEHGTSGELEQPNKQLNMTGNTKKGLW